MADYYNSGDLDRFPKSQERSESGAEFFDWYGGGVRGRRSVRARNR
jgi:hypothetical protein